MLLPWLNVLIVLNIPYELPYNLATVYILNLKLATVLLLVYFQVPSHFQPSVFFA